MTPVELHFGIDNISTDINFDNSLEIDGPAYHHARNAMDTVNSFLSNKRRRMTPKCRRTHRNT